MRTRDLTMTNPEVPPLFRQLFFLVGKIAVVIFFTMAAGWGLGYVLLERNVFLPLVHQIVVVLMSAALSGLLSRFLLRSNGILLAWLGAFLAMTVSLTDLYNLSYGRLGLQVFISSSNTLNFNAVWQLTLGGLVILLALNAWRKSAAAPVVTKQPAAGISAAGEKKAAPAPARAVKKYARRGARSLLPRLRKTIRSFFKNFRKKFRKAFRGAHSQARQAAHRAAAALPRRQAVAAAPLPVVKFHRASQALAQSLAPLPVHTIRRLPKGAHTPIRLVGKEEHRCPYCLCIVSPRDPDGVVICPICHTYHHKSCWDVTGACQVPHLQP